MIGQTESGSVYHNEKCVRTNRLYVKEEGLHDEGNEEKNRW